MEQFLNVVLYPAIFTFSGVAATKFWDWVKPKSQIKIDNADAKAKEIDNEIKSADLYRGLLDDAMKRLNQAIDTINERDEKIKLLMHEIELMTDELKKFKQLNGKQN